MTAPSGPAQLGRVLLVGCGRQGARIFDVATRHQLAREIVAVDPRDPAPAGGKSGPRHFRNLEAALAEGGYDAAIVASTTSTHAEVVEVLLGHGLPTLVEKPIAATLAEGRRLVELAAAGRSRLYVGYVERFNPVVRLLGDVIRRGSVGTPISFSLRRFALPPAAATDVDVVHDLSVHDIDLLSHLQGSPRLLAAAGTTAAYDAQLHSAQLLLVAGGASAVVDTSRMAPRRERTVTVLTDTAQLRADLLAGHVDVVAQPGADAELAALGSFGSLARHEVGSVRLAAGDGEPLALELAAFVRSVQVGDEGDLASAAVALATSAIADEATDLAAAGP